MDHLSVYCDPSGHEWVRGRCLNCASIRTHFAVPAREMLFDKPLVGPAYGALTFDGIQSWQRPQSEAGGPRIPFWLSHSQGLCPGDKGSGQIAGLVGVRTHVSKNAPRSWPETFS